MMEFGKSLRAAREAKGLTVCQIAEQTHLAPRTIELLENEDFSHIAAPIYGRGFVKLYCEAVGLEARPFVDEFMEIFNGNRDTEIRERPTAEISETPKAPASEPETVPASTDVAEPVASEPPPEPQADLFDAAPETPDASAPESLLPEQDEPTLSRYAAPVRQSYASATLPPAFWRIGILALAALALLILIGISIRSLYRATTSTPAKQAPVAEKASAPVRTPTAVPTAARTPQQLPSLYVD